MISSSDLFPPEGGYDSYSSKFCWEQIFKSLKRLVQNITNLELTF